MPVLSQVAWRVCPALMYAHVFNPSMRPFEPCREVLSVNCHLFRSNLRVRVNFEEPFWSPWDVFDFFIIIDSTFSCV